jgi:DNA gyrase subunit B
MLSSQEVATLITALGCGIGPDEYDPEKIRYHRIIIMTDADVDGSHIRTLLLTFFYRQTPELIERGYIYIAQPPLYKVKRGKQEQYVKDDEALAEYLTTTALESASFHPGRNAPAISAKALEELVNQYRKVEKTIKRYKHRYPEDLLSRASYLPQLNFDDLSQKAVVENWVDLLHKSMLQSGSKTEKYQITVFYNQESNLYLPQLTITQHGLDHVIVMPAEFFKSKDYQEMVSVGNKIVNLIDEGAMIQRGEKSQAVETFEQALNWLMDEAKRGQTIQRYKGLGEMNPDQLWETTMDPLARRMLKVNIEDAVAADAIFTTLMGDQIGRAHV